MPIIIDDFEIIPAPPPVIEAPASPPPVPPPLAPEDIDRIEERFRLRLARVWAD